jgi:hypothetical protein
MDRLFAGQQLFVHVMFIYALLCYILTTNELSRFGFKAIAFGALTLE